ncbi:MAG: hypothetical protein ABIS50_17360 [Luteolibacter sp.]|uniref:hypothetical protein n=1 Tax=Luteolibacter sp. TaxID=1962973 RepID=UPI0032662960
MPDPLNKLKRHLADHVTDDAREYDFDVDDKPEAEVIAPFITLKMALGELDRKINQKWADADQEAIRRQRFHRRSATVAIVFGLAAVFLVLIQLGLQLTDESLVSVAKILEMIAVIVATIAAVLGIGIKSDTKWFIQRHIAERLRALRFRALGHPDLWCSKPGDWGQWIDGEVKAIVNTRTIKEVKAWAGTLHAAPEDTPPTTCVPDADNIKALEYYYLYKRVIYQANYFGEKCGPSADHAKHQSALSQFMHRHHGFALFLTSVIMVAIHIFAEHRAPHESPPVRHTEVASHEPPAPKILDFREAEKNLLTTLPKADSSSPAEAISSSPPTHKSGWEILAVWSLVLAGMIPLLSFGIKVWKSAFEPARSLALCVAKESSLRREAIILDTQDINFPQLLENIADIEHFFAHEHAEWLRLMLETDWMP